MLVDQDKEPDRISEESYFLEGVPKDVLKKAVSKRNVLKGPDSERDESVRDAADRETFERGAPVRRQGPRKSGRKFFLFVMVLLLMGFAGPLLLIYLVKWPHPAQHLLIFGISYYKLLFVYFLSSALLIHASLFLLRARPLLVTMFFLLSLFCCLPFIIGLRNNLTLYQVVGGLPFFYDWPFFLNPSYVMIQFLIPAGIVIYLFLQIKNLVAGERRSYSFLCVGIYLSIAAALGLFGLNETNQPNIVTALAGLKGYFTSRPLLLTADPEVSRHPIVKRDEGMQLRIPSKGFAPPFEKRAVETEKRVDELASVTRGLGQLVEKVDIIEIQVNAIRKLLPEKEPAPNKEEAALGMEKKVAKEVSEEQSAIRRLEDRIRLLSEEVGVISNTVKKMASILPMASEEPAARAEPAEQTNGQEKSGNVEDLYPY